MNITNTIFHKCGRNILTYLYENKSVYMSNVSNNLNITYSHTSHLIKIFLEHKLVELKKVGRCRYITLTKKGHNIAKKLTEIGGLL